jgi:hypothetical protein
MADPPRNVDELRAWMSQRLRWAFHVLNPDPDQREIARDAVRNATSWDTVPAVVREMIEKTEGSDPRRR